MYTLNATFDAHVDQEETLAAVLEVLPAGSHATLALEPVILNVTDLGDEHVGSSIRGNIGSPFEFGGVIESVVGTTDGRVGVVVRGVVYSLGVWDTVQVIPPVTEGQHTADEPEEQVEETFDLSADDYNSAVELAFQTEAAVADYITPIAWISRAAVEEVAGRVVTDDEYRIVVGATREALTAVVTPIAGSLIARNLGLYAEAFGEEN